MNENQIEKECVICCTDNPADDMIMPCNCASWVHYGCLSTFRIRGPGQNNMTTCPSCKKDYTYLHLDQKRDESLDNFHACLQTFCDVWWIIALMFGVCAVAGLFSLRRVDALYLGAVVFVVEFILSKN